MHQRLTVFDGGFQRHEPEVTEMGKRFYIKERHNPQLGVYYVACGQLSKAKAKRMDSPLYGDNIMLAFDSEQEYLDELASLKSRGKSVC